MVPSELDTGFRRYDGDFKLHLAASIGICKKGGDNEKHENSSSFLPFCGGCADAGCMCECRHTEGCRASGVFTCCEDGGVLCRSFYRCRHTHAENNHQRWRYHAELRKRKHP